MGVLCDWDQALDTRDPHIEKRRVITRPTAAEMEKKKEELADERVQKSPHDKPSGSEEIVRPRYRTGTGPFMAYDLLKDGEAPPHLYRFDLESFFWLLAWFCAAFDPKTRIFKRKTEWDQPSLYLIGMHKRDFLDVDSVYKSAFEKSDPSYRGLISSWVHKLRRYMQVITSDVTKMDHLKGTINDAVAAGDEDEEAEARKQLEAIQENRVNIVTYKGFMAALGFKDEVLTVS